MNIRLCKKNHEMKWFQSNLPKGCPICKTEKFKYSRYLCEICDEKYCVGCRTPYIYNNNCPLNHKLIEKELYKNTCDVCRTTIMGKGFRDSFCDFDLCEKCMDSQIFEKLLLDETKLDEEEDLQFLNKVLPYNPFVFKNSNHQIELYNFSKEKDIKFLKPIFTETLDIKKPCICLGKDPKNHWVLDEEVIIEHVKIILEFDKLYFINFNCKKPIFHGLQKYKSYDVEIGDELKIGNHIMKFLDFSDKNFHYSLFQDENDSNSKICKKGIWQKNKVYPDSKSFRIDSEIIEENKEIFDNYATLTNKNEIIKISTTQDFNYFLRVKTNANSKAKRFEIFEEEHLYFGDTLYVLTHKTINIFSKNIYK